MDPEKQKTCLALVTKKYTATQPMDVQRVLTSPLHGWILPAGDPQRVARIPIPEQRVTQSLGKDVPTTLLPTPLMRVTNAPAIMATPNPTTKRALKLMPRSHTRQMQYNIPGLVPLITRRD
jgi:hypothetical protein